jgi:hypothetical protein
VTFKELRKIIAEKNRKMEIEAKYYNPTISGRAEK